MTRCFLYLSLLCTAQWLSAQSYSLDEILGAPYCTNLVASPDGHQIAWQVQEKGIRSLYKASEPSWDPTLLYASRSDDGQVMGNLQFDHQGQYLYFVKGSAPNRAGETANPASLVDYPARKLYRTHLLFGTVDEIGPYSNYVIHPDGQSVLVASGHKLLQKRPDHPERTLVTMRGTFSDLALAPSADRIAFTSNRGDHSFIGTYIFGEDRIRWVAPSVYQDALPQWSPDGHSLAFIRTPGQAQGELRDITGGNPFSILIHDLGSAETRTIWSSPADDGGFAQYYHAAPLRWTASGKLVFYSEHEGWMKIYQMEPSVEAAPIALLDGACEIEHSAVNASGDALIFSTNCGDIDRRDLYVYDLTTNEVSQVTDGDEIETDPVFAGEHIFYRKASHDYPTGIALSSGGKTRSIFPVTPPPEYPGKHLVKPEQVVISAPDGTKVHCQLFTQSKSGAPKPGVLFMHGGPIRQMLLGYHYSQYYAFAYAMNQYLASRGYVVLSVNFRAGIGYGRDFRRARDQGPRGASEYQDIKAAGQYLQTLEYVDPERIGLWGGSYGGLLTAQGLARDSDLFKAGVDFHGVHDWSWRGRDFSRGGFWGITEDLMSQAFSASPVADVDQWRSPVLMIHGDDDRNVMFGQTVDLARRLDALDVHYEILVLPDEVHGFYRYDSWLQSYLASASFFDRFLKTKQ